MRYINLKCHLRFPEISIVQYYYVQKRKYGKGNWKELNLRASAASCGDLVRVV